MFVGTEDSTDQGTKKLKFDAASRPPYTPRRKPTTPLPSISRITTRYSGRFKSKHSSVYRSSPLNQAVLDPLPEDQEPVTVQVFVSIFSYI